jgi:hypothetical protein
MIKKTNQNKPIISVANFCSKQGNVGLTFFVKGVDSQKPVNKVALVIHSCVVVGLQPQPHLISQCQSMSYNSVNISMTVPHLEIRAICGIKPQMLG